MNDHRDDYYEILGVSHSASSSDIHDSFINLSKKNHPDQGGSTRLMQMINEAYNIIGDEIKRKDYDNWLKKGKTENKPVGNSEALKDGIVEMITYRSMYSMPQICACCMKPFHKNVNFPIESHTKSNTYIKSSVKVPLCLDCLKHVRRYRRKILLITLLSGFLISCLQSVIVNIFKINSFLAAIPAMIAGIIMISIIFNSLIKSFRNTLHLSGDYPINLSIDAAGLRKFTFHNSGYAALFKIYNPSVGVSNMINDPAEMQKFFRRKRSDTIIGQSFIYALLFCFIAAITFSGAKKEDNTINESTAAESTESETSLSSATKTETLILSGSWEGVWDTDFGDLILKESSDQQGKYSGSYSNTQGSLSGEVFGNELRGTYKEGKNGTSTGSFVFILNNDGDGFTGTWMTDDSDTEFEWNGTKTGEVSETEAETESTTTTTVETTLPYESQERPETALYNSYSDAEMIAPFTVNTSEDGTDYFLKLVDKETGNTIYEFFIRDGETLSLDIALGTYILRYASGDIWYGTEHLFGPDTVYSEGSDELEFYQAGSMVYGFTITLYKVVGGNFDTKAIDPDDFNN